MSRALLICNGEKPGKWLKKYTAQVDFILAVDGGADGALAVGIIPDAIIGDLDSVSSHTRCALKDTPFIHIKRQDNTDLEKALDWLCKQKFTECSIVGAVGGRLDFTLGNILAARPYLKKLKIKFIGQKWILLPLTKNYAFSARKGTRCSFIPLTTCQHVTLKGFKYCVVKENLDTAHIGRSLSNEVSAGKSTISFKKGLLLMYLEQ